MVLHDANQPPSEASIQSVINDSRVERVEGDMLSGILCVTGLLWDSSVMGVNFTIHNGIGTGQ